MKQIISVWCGGVLYQITVSNPAVLRVKKIMEDSGFERDMRFDQLPHAVQEKVTTEMEKNGPTD